MLQPDATAPYPQLNPRKDSSVEGTGFEPSVPLLRKAHLGVANRRRRHERRSHLQVQVRNGNACLEWLPIAFPFAEGPRVRIRLPPEPSPVRLAYCLAPARPRWQAVGLFLLIMPLMVSAVI